MWVASHAQLGGPQVHDDDQGWIGTFKRMEVAEEVARLHNDQTTSLLLNDPRKVRWESSTTVTNENHSSQCR